MNDTNQMVSVPCELLEKALDAAAAVGMQDVADELDRILTPTDEQHQGEPVWFMIANGLSAMHAKAKAISDQQGLDTSPYNVPLYAHPPVDPGEVERLVAANTEYARRHLEQQGEVERLRSSLKEMTTFRDNAANEITRLHDKLDELREGIAKHWKVISDQRTKLDKQDALLRDCFIAMLKGGYAKPLRERIKVARGARTEREARHD